MAAEPEVMCDAANRRPDLHDAVAELVHRAQDAGALRGDLVPADVPMLMCGVGRATLRGVEGTHDELPALPRDRARRTACAGQRGAAGYAGVVAARLRPRLPS